jgi:hypothetical protein
VQQPVHKPLFVLVVQGAGDVDIFARHRVGERASIKDVLVWKCLRAIEKFISENEAMLERETHIIRER